MIAKHVPMRSVGKSDFAGLVRYITDAQSKDHRLGHVQVTNCDAYSVRDTITEVLATQYANTRAESDKTYHLIVSFRAGEQPDAATLQAIERRICDGLGYGEHQRVSTVHHDTDNLHLHIAINKIHPTRYTIHDPYRDHKTLGELCEKLEGEYGLQRDNHQTQKRGAENRADDMERHAGIESLLGWIRRECLEQIQGAQSWAELHQALSDDARVVVEGPEAAQQVGAADLLDAVLQRVGDDRQGQHAELRARGELRQQRRRRRGQAPDGGQAGGDHGDRVAQQWIAAQRAGLQVEGLLQRLLDDPAPVGVELLAPRVARVRRREALQAAGMSHGTGMAGEDQKRLGYQAGPVVQLGLRF